MVECHSSFHQSIDAWRMALPKSFTTNWRERIFLHDIMLHTVSITMGLVYSRSISKDARILDDSAKYVLD